MPKFKNPETGEVYDVLDSCFESGFCKKHDSCSTCQIYKQKNEEMCAVWVKNNPHEAARLMGYEVIEDEQAAEKPSAPPTRASILEEANRCVCGQREQDYGSPEDNFRLIASMWEMYIRQRCVGSGADVSIMPEDVAMLMALLKIARICTGTGMADSFVDLAGYAACGGEIAGGKK